MPVHVITMVPSIPPQNELTSSSSSPHIQDLRDALQSNGGVATLPILAGDATVFVSKTLKCNQKPHDVIITKHKSVQAYRMATDSKAYKTAIVGIENVQVIGFEHNSVYIDWIFPGLKKLYNFFQLKVDCETPALPPSEQSSKQEYDLFQANGDSGIEKYKHRVGNNPNQSFYMIQLMIKNGSPDGKKADTEYSKAWLQAAFSYGVDIILGGTTQSLDGGPKMFGEIAIVKYPTRETFVKWMESDYFSKVQEHRRSSILDTHVEVSLPIY
jgi:uncharacterized protein (DUF1330 family)